MHNIFSHNIVKEKHKTKENMSPELVQQQNSSPKSAGDRIDAWLEHTDDDVFRVTAEQDSRVEVRRRAAQHQSEAISQDTSTYITETSTENTSPPRGSPRTASTQPTRRPLEVRTYRVAGDPVVSKVKIDSRGQEISSETTATVSDTTARPSTNEQPKRPLSTIVSVTTDHTVSTASRPTILKTHSDVTRHTSRTARRSSHRKSRRTTTHDDLISVLSMPPEDAPSLMSARSVRKRRETLDSPFASILKELELDEQRYRQELRTLVKGVVPVLRSHELNKDSASITTASNVPDSPSVAGIGRILDKLWSQHDRMPTNDAKAFIAWTNVVQSVYQDYLAAWKMGFDDVTVNLGPANHDGLPSVVSVTNTASTDDNRVDVAFLLKRPLVRLKTLHRTLQDLDDTDSTLGAEPMALQFRDLVAEARKKSNEERARLEDEAAAAIDASKTRDPYTLQRLTGIKIDPTRIVRARDYFDMTLHHSAGQTTDCRIELLLRDDRDDAIADGDVLICEVTNLGRWLLFPPMPHDSVMVKAGLQVNELHVTLCDTLRDGSERRETMLLRSIEPDVTEQWLEMLSEYVEPPHIKSQPKQLPVATADDAVDRPPPVPFHRHSVASSGSLSSRSELHTPIGETTSPYKKRWTATETLAQATPNAFHHQQDLPAVQDRRQPRPIYDNAPPIQSDAASLISGSGSGYSSRDSRSERPYSAYSSDIASQMYPDLQQAQRPHTADDQMQRSRDMPTNPQSPPRSPRRKPVATPTRPIVEPITSQRVERTPQSAPPKLEGQRPREVAFQEETPSTPKLKSKPKLGFIPALKTTLGFRPRRPSSPLKHEYAPSPSGSELDSDPESSHDDDDASITSESSHESDDEFDDKPLPINIRKYRDERPGSALVRVPVAGALSPSSSPVPSPSRGNSRPVSRQIQPVTKAVAGIYSWAETGSWEKLRERDVAIVVSPGLLEAFDMHEVHSVPDTGQSPTVSGIMPLIALELTPLVPIRRGTALDISIRSPPAPMSRIKRTDNVMLRSRSPEECETLYHYINQSRINNATFIAMQAQSAQMPVAVPVADVDWANTIGPPGSRRGPASWLSQHGPRRAGSYRNRSSRRSLISGGTMQSALSALRRFSHGGGGTSGGGRLRNLAKGVSSSRSTETRTLSFSKATTTTGASGSSGTQNSANSAGGESQAHTGLTVLSSTITAPEGLGLNNTKIRLYIRETASKWRDLGNARLTVSLPPAPQQQVSEDGAGDDEDEKEDTAQLDPLDALHAGKRITIQALPSRVPSRSDMTMTNTATTTTMATVLLDQVLPETAFERVARTGIAVSVWEESVDAQGTLGGSRDRGGVVAGVQRVYMLQMASVRLFLVPQLPICPLPVALPVALPTFPLFVSQLSFLALFLFWFMFRK